MKIKQNQAYLVAKGIAGLGNRLISLTAALEYAKATGRSPYVDWTDGRFAPEGSNAFEQYFELINIESVQTSGSFPLDSIYPSVYKHLEMDKEIYHYYDRVECNNRFLRKGLHYIFKGMHAVDRILCSSVFEHKLAVASLLYQKFLLKYDYQTSIHKNNILYFGSHLPRKLNEQVVIYCDYVPSYRPETMTRHIRLNERTQNKVDQFVKENNLAEATVGVHVRAAGKKCYGDLQKFIIKLKLFLKKHDYKQVFLCTDNAKIEALFQNAFGDALVVQPKYLPEIQQGETGIHDFAQNSGDALLQEKLTEEAIVDMFALAKTNYLFYQFGSTFSEISKNYHSDLSKCKSWMLL